MARQPNTDKNGRSFSLGTRRAVWQKTAKAEAFKPSIARKDVCGALIYWKDYGNTVKNSGGWEIDHIKPVAEGGDDNSENLQALQWQNNRAKGDDYPPGDFCIMP